MAATAEAEPKCKRGSAAADLETVPVSQRPFLNLKLAAACYGLSVKSLRKLIAMGTIQEYRPVPGLITVSREELESHIRSSSTQKRRGRGKRQPAAV